MKATEQEKEFFRREGYTQAMQDFDITEDGKPFDKICQESVEEFRKGLLGRFNDHINNPFGFSIGDIQREIESYNLPLK